MEQVSQDGLKRLIDILFSSVALIAFWPAFLILFMLIKLEDRGIVFYRPVRIGRYGEPFKMFKLRTMVPGADKLGGPSTPADDPRITKIGRLIRKLNLDELAQFIDVFRGKMSIVGPRPEVAQYIALLKKEEKESILSVRPGITDWATLWIRDEGRILAGSLDPEKDYLEKIRPNKVLLQLKYVKGRSISGDISIMLQTLKVHFIDRFKR